MSEKRTNLDNLSMCVGRAMADLRENKPVTAYVWLQTAIKVIDQLEEEAE